MNILSIDTSSPETSVALLAGQTVFSKSAHASDSHNEEIAVLVSEIIEEAKISANSLELVLLGSGPGSFTGLRIGYSFVQGLISTLHIPVLTTSSLYSGCFHKSDGTYIGVSDARRGEYFCCVLSISHGVAHVEKEPFIASETEVAVLIEKHQLPKGRVVDISGGNAKLAVNGISLWSSTPTLFQRYNRNELAQLKPLYLRPVAALTIEERRVKGALDQSR